MLEDTEKRENEQETEKKVRWNREKNQRHNAHQYTQNKIDAIRKEEKVNMSV